jgi:hypothetical protein
MAIFAWELKSATVIMPFPFGRNCGTAGDCIPDL